MCSVDLFLGVLAILFPPLPVWVKCGICSVDSVINILLCILGFLPGLLHAWYIIAKYPDPGYEYEALPNDAGESRVRYVFVRDNGSHCPHPQHHQHQSQPQYQSPPAPGSHVASPPPPPPPQQQQQQQQHRQQDYGTTQAGPSDGGAPPSYTEAVGDHKVQSRD